MASIWLSLRSTSHFIAKTKARTLFQTAMLLAALCIVLIHMAMFAYEGGTINSPILDGYSWTHNFLSDLGRDCVCHTYRDNAPSNHLFLVGMTLAGLSIGIYMWALPSLFTRKVARNFAVAASTFGVISGWFFIRVGWEPIDRDFRAHQWYAMTALLSFACTVLACSVAIFTEPFPRNCSGFPLLALASPEVEWADGSLKSEG